MPHSVVRCAIVFALAFGLAPAVISQDLQIQPQTSQTSAINSSESIATYQSTTRMVTLEVVVKDARGRHATGLKPGDFQISEQIPTRGKEKREQKIAAFQEIRAAELASDAVNPAKDSEGGVYTNELTALKNPVPVTILLVDGLNTDLRHQAQVHVQMLHMLKSLPRDVPIAVFLFGGRLRMLQDFTSDPGLLQAALRNAVSASATGVARLDPRDDPSAISAEFDKVNGTPAVTLPSPQAGSIVQDASPIPKWIVDGVKRFEQETYASSMDLRVQQTIEALASIGRHVAGYPGRKNLLWVSTSFPIYLSPLIDDLPKPITGITGFNAAGWRNYESKLRALANVLSESKVAVYPINPAGVQVPTLFEAGNRTRDYSGRGMGDSLRRETMMRSNEQDTMQVLAEGTGGRVCAGTNDLGDCVRKAVEDSGAFYEIAYYPDVRDWKGEFRKIIVKARDPGLHLAYRQGYFARPEERNGRQDQKAELQQAACEDYLNATSIPFSAKSLPTDSSGSLKFYLTIDSSSLTLTPTIDGRHDLNMLLAVCTFDMKGEPFLFMNDAVQRQFDAAEFRLVTERGLPHVVSIPGPKPSSLRLLIMDVPSGRLGSVKINIDDMAASGQDAVPSENDKHPPAR